MSRSLRVLLLNERDPAHPRAGGAETHLFEVFGRLVDDGIETELLCSSADGRPSTDAHRGVRITRLGGLVRFYATVAREVRRRTRHGAVDLVVEAHNKVPFLTPLYAGVPVVVLHHHLFGRTAFAQAHPVIAAGTVALERLIPRVYRRVPIVTISASSRDDLVRRGLPANICVAHCGFDADTYSCEASALGDREPLLVCVGRLERSKRLDLLLDAMAHVPPARLVLVGRGTDESRLRALVDRRGLHERVTFAGFMPDADVAALLRRAALALQPSTKEGWGLTVIEAAACGVPTIAADAPGLRDSVRDGASGVLLRDPTPAAFAAAITRLLRDEPERLRLAQGALAWSHSFSWDTTAAAIGQVLREAQSIDSMTEPSASVTHGLPSVRGVP